MLKESKVMRIMKAADRMANSMIRLFETQKESCRFVITNPNELFIAQGLESLHEAAKVLFSEVSGIKLVDRVSEEFPTEKSFTYINDIGNQIRCFSIYRR